MMTDETTKLAQAWISLQSAFPESEQESELEWSSNKLNRLILRDPIASWDIVLAIAGSSSDAWVLENLGSGPIEMLLTQHPHEAIRLLEEDLRVENPNLRVAIEHVWLESVPVEIRDRIKSLLG